MPTCRLVSHACDKLSDFGQGGTFALLPRAKYFRATLELKYEFLVKLRASRTGLWVRSVSSFETDRAMPTRVVEAPGNWLAFCKRSLEFSQLP